MCNTPARTIRGLIAKARLCKIDSDCIGADHMAESIVDDLLALDGGAA